MNAPTSWCLTANEARAILRLGPIADSRDIRRAFTRAAKEAHPDRPGGDAARFRLVAEAYQLLTRLSLVPVARPESVSRQQLRRFAAAWAA
ncbi:MAG TPA: DnaJ domain-containing protein [Caulobacteraceae bacterium]|nr:DnaJ domain-containing protein [Caulobacteraceae bacterium]